MVAIQPDRFYSFWGKQRLLGLFEQIIFSAALEMNMRLFVHFPMRPDEWMVELGPHPGQARLYHRDLVTSARFRVGR